jgi:hypothetical protein
MHAHLIALSAALSFAFAGSSPAADNDTGMSKETYKVARDRVESQAKFDSKPCNKMKGNAKDVCHAQVKGKAKVAKAELDAKYKPSPKADVKIRLAQAEADYDVAREKCDEQKDGGRDACLKQARNAHDSAATFAKSDKAAKSAASR